MEFFKSKKTTLKLKQKAPMPEISKRNSNFYFSEKPLHIYITHSKFYIVIIQAKGEHN